MLARYVWRDLVRNPRRSLAALMGITLGVGLFSAVLFFIDGSSASMTQRAVAPLPIDMQRVLTAPLGGRLHLTQVMDAPATLAPGVRATVHLELVNDSAAAANEVVLRSEPPTELSYVAGSAALDGATIPTVDEDNPLAHGPGKTGLNLGTVQPGRTITLDYQVQARTAVTTAAGPAFRTSFSSREIITPVRANAPDPVGLHELATSIARLDGVASADELSFADLPAASLAAGSATTSGSLRLFGFDARYQRRYTAIDIVDGRQVPGGALISVEAARDLGVAVGDTVALTIPGASAPVQLTISGTVDLSRAKALFYSRQGSNLEDFLYTPNSLVIDPTMFAETVVPALLTASTTRGGEAGSVPIREVDVAVVRSRLDADPGTALAQAARIATAVRGIAPEQDYLVDNLSNTLEVAREDSGVAKRMFVFLGVPGGLLAAILAAYAGAVLAGAQRREQAILRIRGANRRHLARMLALRSALLTGAGSVLGLAVGALTALTVLGADALSRAAAPSLIVSGLIGAGGGFLATGAALYGAGRGAIRREINDDRARLFSRPPSWRRFRLDLLSLLAVGAIAALALRADAFAGTPGSVYDGRGVRLNLWLLALPVCGWIGGALLGGRLFAGAMSALPNRSARFPHVVRGILTRSLRRRSWAAVQGMIVVALIVGAGTSITAFTASYDQAKAADARFVLGSDIRVTPSPALQTNDGTFATSLESTEGIAGVTPVVYGVENAVVRSSHNEDAANVAAVDPSKFRTVAALDDRNFVGTTAARALTALTEDPSAALLSTQLAEFISAVPGDRIRVLFASGTAVQASSEMHVVGLFERLPGFPDGADALVNIARQEELIPSTAPDFFLARTKDGQHSTLTGTVARLSDGPAARMTVATRETTLDKDQSSLAALNIHGLLTLDSGYALAMATVAIGIFVFGLLLQRRREYVTMRAQGLQSAEIRALVVAETGTVTVAGCVVGVAVGIGMAFFLVNVLRPLFILPPYLVLPAGGIATLVLLIVAATVVSSVAATALIGRLDPTELLRED